MAEKSVQEMLAEALANYSASTAQYKTSYADLLKQLTSATEGSMGAYRKELGKQEAEDIANLRGIYEQSGIPGAGQMFKTIGTDIQPEYANKAAAYYAQLTQQNLENQMNWLTQQQGLEANLYGTTMDYAKTIYGIEEGEEAKKIAQEQTDYARSLDDYNILNQIKDDYIAAKWSPEVALAKAKEDFKAYRGYEYKGYTPSITSPTAEPSIDSFEGITIKSPKIPTRGADWRIPGAGKAATPGLADALSPGTQSEILGNIRGFKKEDALDTYLQELENTYGKDITAVGDFKETIDKQRDTIQGETGLAITGDIGKITNLNDLESYVAQPLVQTYMKKNRVLRATYENHKGYLGAMNLIGFFDEDEITTDLTAIEGSLGLLSMQNSKLPQFRPKMLEGVSPEHLKKAEETLAKMRDDLLNIIDPALDTLKAGVIPQNMVQVSAAMARVLNFYNAIKSNVGTNQLPVRGLAYVLDKGIYEYL